MALLLSLKVLLISTFILFTALGLNISVSLITQFLATHVPLTWNFFLLFFKPPYLILLINAIIIAIAASSKFHHSHHPTPPLPFKPPPPPVEVQPDQVEVNVKSSVVVNGEASDEENGMESPWTPPEREESTETPPPPTLEDVWKMITKERATVVLKKSETFKVKDWRDIPMVCATATSFSKEPSLSQDELNQRVEGFITKINEEMRLQKQDSLINHSIR